MTPVLLRQLWKLVEAAQATHLIQLDDGHLTQWLVRELQREAGLSGGDQAVVDRYIRSKLPLIRDMAYERLSG